MLRAKKPEAVTKRLKLFMFGPAGVGKTTAAIQFPNSYIIDAERGSENYDKLITQSGSVVFQTTDIHEVIQEVKSLLTEKHDFRTLVIDPITPLYNDLLDKCEMQVGADFGRHYGAANKTMKRLANLIMALDMNVVITAHAKTEYGVNFSKLGYTFDGWRQLDYWFDLVVELTKKGKKRMAKVVKTRVESFPDEDVFEWSYQAIRSRYDVGMLEKEAQVVQLATPEQVRDMKELLNVVRLPEGTTDKWFAKAGVDVWEDMPTDVIAKCIEYVKNRLPSSIEAA
ncbi:MAG: AAA family ATPase [Bacillota bacterium]